MMANMAIGVYVLINTTRIPWGEGRQHHAILLDMVSAAKRITGHRMALQYLLKPLHPGAEALRER